MLTLERALIAFNRGIERANSNIALFTYVRGISPPALSCDDLLRSAIVTASSAFDLLQHEAYRACVISGVKSQKLNVMHSLSTDLVHLPLEDALITLEKSIKSGLSHRSFLMPDKISELYTPILQPFWATVAKLDNVPEAVLKNRVRQLALWRNRIVHESDINPDLAGVDEWPIIKEDTSAAVQDYAALGATIVRALERRLS